VAAVLLLTMVTIEEHKGSGTTVAASKFALLSFALMATGGQLW
jgi:hypothetical protein